MPVSAVKTEVPDTGNGTRQIKREVTCYNCRQKGHKSPQCPLRQSQVKRIEIPSDKVVQLRGNDLVGTIGVHKLPITCDSGADVTFVDPKQLTGGTRDIKCFGNSVYKGKVCNIVMDIHGRTFSREAVTQPGEVLKWTACLSMSFDNIEETDFLLEKIRSKKHRPEEETLYLPPECKNGALRSGTLVSEGILVEPEEPVVEVDTIPEVVNESREQSITKPESQQEVQSVEEISLVNNEGDGDSLRKSEQNLVEVENPSDLVEVVGESLGGSANSEGTQDLSVEGITSGMPRTEIATATREDISIQHLYKLATLKKEGYFLKDSILLRTGLDVFGQPADQICLPTPYRQKCLRLAHNHFGHQGRTKMTELIKPFFYWPNMSRDCLAHVRSCDVCQKMDKANPKPNSMQLREITTVPFESVAIDLVGPFPTAVGSEGF